MVTVAERAGDPERFADRVSPEKNAVERLGILGLDLDDDDRAAMLPGLRARAGVVVATADPRGGRGALVPGDVIYAVNQDSVTGIETLRQALARVKAGTPLVLQAGAERRAALGRGGARLMRVRTFPRPGRRPAARRGAAAAGRRRDPGRACGRSASAGRTSTGSPTGGSRKRGSPAPFVLGHEFGGTTEDGRSVAVDPAIPCETCYVVPGRTREPVRSRAVTPETASTTAASENGWPGRSAAWCRCPSPDPRGRRHAGAAGDRDPRARPRAPPHRGQRGRLRLRPHRPLPPAGGAPVRGAPVRDRARQPPPPHGGGPRAGGAGVRGGGRRRGTRPPRRGRRGRPGRRAGGRGGQRRRGRRGGGRAAGGPDRPGGHPRRGPHVVRGRGGTRGRGSPSPWRGGPATCIPARSSSAASGRVDLRSMVTHRFPLERVREAFEAATRRVGHKVLVEG